MTKTPAHPLARPGAVGVTRGTHLVDRVVQVGTSSRYNHVAVCVDLAPDGRPIAVEASPHGATRRPVDPRRFVWDSLPLSAEQRSGIVHAASACEGLPYDWIDIARFVVLHQVGRARGWTKDHPDAKVICSEIAAWAWQTVGVQPWPMLAPGDVSPGRIADFLLRCGSPRTLLPNLPHWAPPRDWERRVPAQR